jgi:hypothetical protein
MLVAAGVAVDIGLLMCIVCEVGLSARSECGEKEACGDGTNVGNRRRRSSPQMHHFSNVTEIRPRPRIYAPFHRFDQRVNLSFYMLNRHGSYNYLTEIPPLI